jgi:aldose 1-epimerase
MFERGEDLLPTGSVVAQPSGPHGDCFEVVGGGIAFRWPGALELALQTDCDYAVVFTHPEDLVCVEPMTGSPDWINRYPVVVSPGDPRTARAAWVWSIPEPRR